MTRRGAGSSFDPRRSRVVSRGLFSEEYENADGTRTLRQSSVPLNVRGSDGRWRPVDAGLSVERGSGRLEAKRHPLSPSLAGHADESDLVALDVDGARVTLGLMDARGARAQAGPDGVLYRDVLADTDVLYEVTAGEVKETIRVKEPGSSAWRFELDTAGLTPRMTPDGGIALSDEDGPRAVLPPVVAWDSAGTSTRAPATTGGGYQLERVGDVWRLTVVVDEAWMRDPARVYPVSVDPTFSFPDDVSYAYKSDGASCQNCGLQIGNPLDAGKMWRSAFHFDYSSLWGKTVVGARLDVSNTRTPKGVDKTYPAQLHHATAFDFDGVGQLLGEGLIGQVGSFSDSRFTSYLRTAVANRDLRPYFMLVGSEQADVWTYKNMVTTLYVDTGSAPPAATRVAPADNSVLTSLTPTLQVSPVTDADGDPVRYCFRVATGSDAKSGVVVDSGCLTTPTWTVPAGVLQDGVSYTWQASTSSGVVLTEPSWVGQFKVDQRIGARGPAPVDEIGAVEVNLANGNVTTSQSTPTFTTVGGTAGLTFTYNSQQRDAAGLRASYFTDLSHTGNIADGQQPALVRTEPQVNVDWAADSPLAPALASDWFVVRWEGFFQAPATGSFQFAGVHDDGLKVWLNGNQVYGVATPSDVNWTQATAVALTAGQRVPIKVEFAEKTGAARTRLFVRTNDGTTTPAQVVPAAWLATTDSPAMPQGWTLSADLDGTSAAYTTAQVTDQTVVLTDATGAKHTYTKKSVGGYSPPDGEDGILALDSGGRVTLTEGEAIYTFRPDGRLETLTNVADSRKPAAMRNIYDGTPSRLKKINDPVSGREHVLSYNRSGDNCYGTTPVPTGFDSLPPAQMLCRITYWDGTETRLWYAGGRLARVEDPGSEITDYAYYPEGPLSGVRDNLAADWVAEDPAARGGTTATMTVINYDTTTGPKPKATSVIEPEPMPGQARPQHSYRHDPANRQTFVDVAGLNPATGYASKVTYDDSERLLSTTDATGRVTRQTWNVEDQLLTSTDAAGRVSTTVYDHVGRTVDSYGPASASCFTGQLPTAACANTVAREHTNYDEGINGLSGAYYDNATLTGAPKVFATGVGHTDGSQVQTWPAAPVTGIPGTNWSARFTGELIMPDAGTYQITPFATDGLRVWIDDTLVIDGWSDQATVTKRTGTFTNTTAGAIHRVRLDFYNRNGNAVLHFNWARPGQPEQNIPGQYLKSRYGLATSTLTYESGGVPAKRTATRYGENGLDPVLGLATSTSVDPLGINLTSRTSYEAPGSGYLRATGKTMPTGAHTTYTSYGDTETRANPCVPGSPAVNQGGLAKSNTSPAPASGPALVEEQVYDASGRIVAEATAGDWTCTTFDARDRTIRQSFPATSVAPARVVETNYAVNGDPLTTAVTDHHGTITTKVDLLGRVVEYTDVHGTWTETTYDRAGRVTAERLVPPNPDDAVQLSTFTYDDADRLLTVQFRNTVLATAGYDAAGELATVSYANGTALTGIGRDQAGDTVSLTWRTADGRDTVSTVTRTRAGTVVDETVGGVDARPNGPNYVYDGAGRLIQAWAPGHQYTFDFTATASGNCPTGTQASAGANTNRMRLLDITSAGTAETSYCYDAADRILATTGASAMTGIAYDSHGNTTQWQVAGHLTTLGWDGADRNVTARTTGADPAEVTYARDATDRIVRRDASAGGTTATALYSYTGDGDNADLTLAGDHYVTTRTITLPGDVLYTENFETETNSWDYPTVRGDIALTVDNTGHQIGDLKTYTPHGEPVTPAGSVDPDHVPDNQPGEMDYGWLGQHQRHYEHAGALSIVQMGARPYLPLLGRFLSVDPVEGGSANDYDYTSANPTNQTDVDGRCPLCLVCIRWLCKVGKATKKIARSGWNRTKKAAFATRKAIKKSAKWTSRKARIAKQRGSRWWRTTGFRARVSMAHCAKGFSSFYNFPKGVSPLYKSYWGLVGCGYNVWKYWRR